MARQMTEVRVVEQLELFGCVVASALMPARRPRIARPAANEPEYHQLTLAPEDGCNDLLPRLVLDEDSDYPVHRLTSAAQCGVPKDIGPASIFAAGAAACLSNLMGTIRQDQPEPIHRRIVREAGHVVHRSMRVQDTDEWMEKERQRRARQKPPKPPKQKFKTKGSRVWADARS